MFCPKCKTEYIEGIKTCADCKVSLVKELPPPAETAEVSPDLMSPDFIRPTMVFCTEDSYDFTKAAEALKEAGIPFYGDEKYADELIGEFQVTGRFSSPFRWTIFVEESRVAEACDALAAKEMDFLIDNKTYGSDDEEEAIDTAEDKAQVTGQPNPWTPARRPAQSQIIIAGDGSIRKFILLVIVFAVISAVIMLLKNK